MATTTALQGCSRAVVVAMGVSNETEAFLAECNGCAEGETYGRTQAIRRQLLGCVWQLSCTTLLAGGTRRCRSKSIA
jgi:hypothetical protein